MLCSFCSIFHEGADLLHIPFCFQFNDIDGFNFDKSLGYWSFILSSCQPASQQCFSLTPNQHQPPATSQPTILFSYNKSASATSHSQPNRVNRNSWNHNGIKGKQFLPREKVAATGWQITRAVPKDPKKVISLLLRNI